MVVKVIGYLSTIETLLPLILIATFRGKYLLSTVKETGSQSSGDPAALDNSLVLSVFVLPKPGTVGAQTSIQLSCSLRLNSANTVKLSLGLCLLILQ